MKRASAADDLLRV